MSDKAIDWARKVSVHLEGEWSAKPGHWGNGEDAYLIGPGAERVHIICGDTGWSQAGKLYMHATHDDELSKLRRYNAKRYEMNVSTSKSPERIAREMERRLFPGYREEIAELLAIKRHRDEIDALESSIAEQLFATFGANKSRDGHSGKFGKFDNGGSFEVYSTDVKLELRFPHGTAIAVAQAIARALADRSAS